MRKKNQLVLCVSAAVVMFSVSAAGQDRSNGLSVRSRKNGSATQLILENRFLRLTFDPNRGGRCSEFLLKDSGEQIIGKGAGSGMFIDHWSNYPGLSGLMHLPYKYKLVKNGKIEAGVQLWLQVPSLGGGKGAPDAKVSLKMKTFPDLIGLIVRKTIWLRADSNRIRVEQEIVNKTAKSRAAGIHIQQVLGMGGSHYGDSWYLPSTSGIEVNLQPTQKGGRIIGPDWIPDPVGGWLAVRDRRSGRGLVFAFDYNYLQKTYTSGSSGEWIMELVPIRPGKTSRTEYVIKPVSGFKDFVYGSKRLVADIQPDETDNGRVRVSHDLAAVSGELLGVNVELRVTDWKRKTRLATKTFRVPRLDSRRLRQQFTFSGKALANGVVITAIVSSGKNGKRKEERYEYFYAGDKAEHEARYNLFATKGGALSSARGDAYFRRQPRKRKTYDKPDFAKLAGPMPGQFRCLVVFGLYTHILNLDDAVAGWRSGGRIPVKFDWANCPPNGVQSFPRTYPELFRYNLVVLSDVNYKALGDIAVEMLCDYVHEGGRLLVIGGPYAYGNGEFQNSRFLDVLPVRLSGPFDLKWAGKGKSWKLSPTSAKHSILKGLSFRQAPRVFWHHFVTPKKNATVVLRAGKQPALVVGRYGKGKVAALTLSPTGVGGKGEVAWWAWNSWFPLVRNVFAWLTDKENQR